MGARLVLSRRNVSIVIRFARGFCSFGQDFANGNSCLPDREGVKSFRPPHLTPIEIQKAKPKKLSAKKSESTFEAHPEYDGQAVRVDCTLNPHLPDQRSCPNSVSMAARQKQIPSNNRGTNLVGGFIQTLSRPIVDLPGNFVSAATTLMQVCFSELNWPAPGIPWKSPTYPMAMSQTRLIPSLRQVNLGERILPRMRSRPHALSSRRQPGGPLVPPFEQFKHQARDILGGR